ncbi:MAG: glycerol-3-phosphate acyltransferase, partial [Mycoplasmataceae bacterium]|nr:glycerol-3-phosphate acyltransferase [Mycoplasmataceae bacterium]
MNGSNILSLIFFVVFACITTYFVCNILFAQLIAKAFYKVDIRKQGSGNPGATNLLRVTKSKKVGVIAALCDAGKGYICVLVFAELIGLFLKYNGNGNASIRFLAFLPALFAVVGHCFPIKYLVKLARGVKGTDLKYFSGGKGVSTFGGCLLAISPYMGLICFIVWFIIAYISKYVSLASIISTVICCPLIFVHELWIPGNFPIDYTYNETSLGLIFVIQELCALIVVWRHSANIIRLVKKT